MVRLRKAATKNWMSLTRDEAPTPAVDQARIGVGRAPELGVRMSTLPMDGNGGDAHRVQPGSTAEAQELEQKVDEGEEVHSSMEIEAAVCCTAVDYILMAELADT